MEEQGWVRISVTEANGTIPVEGAFVTVRDYGEDGEGDVVRALTTDADGLTEAVPLGVPPAGDSLSPGSETPAGLFTIQVSAEGYYDVEVVGVQVFAGVLSLQQVDLKPLDSPGADYAEDRYVLYETPRTESLLPGGLTREDIGNGNGTLSGGVVSEERRNGTIPGEREEGGGA